MRNNRSTEIDVEFSGINEMNPSVHEFWDGFVGIQPYTADISLKDDNFMYQLK